MFFSAKILPAMNVLCHLVACIARDCASSVILTFGAICGRITPPPPPPPQKNFNFNGILAALTVDAWAVVPAANGAQAQIRTLAEKCTDVFGLNHGFPTSLSGRRNSDLTSLWSPLRRQRACFRRRGTSWHCPAFCATNMGFGEAVVAGKIAAIRAGIPGMRAE